MAETDRISDLLTARDNGIAEGLRLGEAKGRVEGLTLGEAKGRAEGLAEGLAEGVDKVLALIEKGLASDEIKKILGR